MYKYLFFKASCRKIRQNASFHSSEMLAAMIQSKSHCTKSNSEFCMIFEPTCSAAI